MRKALEFKETFNGSNGIVSEVVVEETSLNSKHFLVKIRFEGAGDNSQISEFGVREKWWGREMMLTEGHGLFSKEAALGLAKLLTA